MAKPRVFISSTYFDLKAVRSDLEHFVRERGFDPILHERGQIPYGRDKPLEKYCYDEIVTCDILVSIVGARYGSQAQGSSYSISQNELKRALEEDKQVYIFVDRDVYHEYKTYSKNKGMSVKWSSVDNEAIFEFLEEIYSLSNNNPILPFETSQDITTLLKEQWAGLFQRLLQNSSQQTQSLVAMELRRGLDTVKSLVDAISSKDDGNDSIIKEIILANHPAFSLSRKLMAVPYRIMFFDRDEFSKWLKIRSFSEVDEDLLDSPEYFEWVNNSISGKTFKLLKVKKEIFDENGKLKMFTNDTWKDSWMKLETRTKSNDTLDDDDVPF